MGSAGPPSDPGPPGSWPAPSPSPTRSSPTATPAPCQQRLGRFLLLVVYSPLPGLEVFGGQSEGLALLQGHLTLPSRGEGVEGPEGGMSMILKVRNKPGHIVLALAPGPGPALRLARHQGAEDLPQQVGGGKYQAWGGSGEVWTCEESYY